MDEFCGKDGCVLCNNSGKIKTKDGLTKDCICPNGRGIKKDIPKFSVQIITDNPTALKLKATEDITIYDYSITQIHTVDVGTSKNSIEIGMLVGKGSWSKLYENTDKKIKFKDDKKELIEKILKIVELSQDCVCYAKIRMLPEVAKLFPIKK